MKNIHIYNTFRFILGVIFLSSGIGKFQGTSGLIGPGWLFEELSKHNLLMFAIFIALAELIVGYLLLVKRFAPLGAVMLFPMLLSILVVVISLDWQGTPIVDGILLIMNLYLIIYNYEKFLPILGISNKEDFLNLINQTKIYTLILLLIIISVFSTYYIHDNFKYLKTVGLISLITFSCYRWYSKRKINSTSKK